MSGAALEWFIVILELNLLFCVKWIITWSRRGKSRWLRELSWFLPCEIRLFIEFFTIPFWHLRSVLQNIWVMLTMFIGACGRWSDKRQSVGVCLSNPRHSAGMCWWSHWMHHSDLAVCQSTSRHHCLWEVRIWIKTQRIQFCCEKPFVLCSI